MLLLLVLLILPFILLFNGILDGFVKEVAIGRLSTEPDREERDVLGRFA